MKPKWLLWSYVPHILSSACFATAFVWISIVETNRSDPDRLLGTVGFLGLAAAVAATVAAVTLLVRHRVKLGWLWQSAHVGGLVLAMALGHNWLGAHIA